ncbi:hypothetical protein FQZ97_1008590 [compost metagenome]
MGARAMAVSIPITVIARAGAACAFHTSRTMARASTSAAQAPRPWATRPRMKPVMLSASSIQAVAAR